RCNLAVPVVLQLTVLSRSPAPTRSTLFPYTTLFRSREHDESRADLDQRLEERYEEVDPVLELVEHADLQVQPADAKRVHPPTPEDRKSTRLNSSHQISSYAVFCLKKKISTHDVHIGK